MSAGTRPLGIGDKKLFGGIADETMPSPFELCLKGNIEKGAGTLAGVFVELVRLFWTDTGNFITRFPKELRWTPNPVTSRLIIDTEYNFSEAYKDPSTIIGIKLGALQYTPTVGTPLSGIMATNLDTSEIGYSQTCTGTVTFRHVGTTDAQSIIMADETFELMRAFAPIIRSDLCFKSLNMISRTPIAEKPVKWYGKERFASDATAQFVFEDIWTMKRECPKLQEIIFSTGHTDINRFIIPTESASQAEL